MTERGYSASKDQLLARLRRIEGQVRGIERMVVDDRYCIDVLTQISAVQAALDKVALGLMDDHVQHCVISATGDAKRLRLLLTTAYPTQRPSNSDAIHLAPYEALVLEAVQ